jgi:hypothetical protein
VSVHSTNDCVIGTGNVCLVLESFEIMCIYRRICDVKVSFPDVTYYLIDFVDTVMHPVGCEMKIN